MKHVEKHTGLFVYSLSIGILQFLLAGWFYLSDQKWFLYLFIPLGISSLVRALDVRKQVWTFNNESGRYEVVRNNKLLFSGAVDDLLAITSDSRSYTIYPHKGRRVVIPRSIAIDFMNDFYQAYRTKIQAEQVVALDG